ncbi:GlxA family transcriptional regulator [Psychromicrobium xiongbiense]|uniref:GlxA family transcriptional regulator n=1 Tax=Psychromicrobium xiongbiense TaxID=3051184 RepID=UPI00255227D0|nr:helix-turn-helix domain-containing protein [Psychromicrobium sp. YIM S02556]
MHMDSATPPARPPQTVAVLALPEILPLDFGIFVQILNRLTGGRYHAWTCAEGPVPAIGGYTLTAERGLDSLAEADTIVVPGHTHPEQTPSPAVLAALRAAHARGARLASVCVGSFALAHAGVLDGLEATTHWEHAASFARMFPRVRVRPEVLYVDAGQVLTSAGVAAGIDLCLHLIRRDFGAAVSLAAARGAVASPYRSGQQAQFVRPAPPARQPDELSRVTQWALQRLREPLGSAELASRAGLSERTLHRRFTETLGCSPQQWLSQQRVLAACELLESSDLPVESVAIRVGLGSAANFRTVFKRQMLLTPSAYREQFAGIPESEASPSSLEPAGARAR